MLSNSLIWKSRVYSICARSGEILTGDTFKGVRLADNDRFDSVPADAVVICCGKIKDDELLFRTVDGRYYFSLCDGCGSESGVLYGLSRGILFDFKHPTTNETILSECQSNLGTYHTWAGAMAYQSRKLTLDSIATVIRKEAKL